MRLSRKSEYACLALICLAENTEKVLVKTNEIARSKMIPRKYLEQILLLLNRAGYISSARGTGGGYKLAKKPAEITLAEIIRLIDGPLAPVDSVSRFFYKPSPVEQHAKLTAVFQEIRDLVSEKLEHTTFADLL